MKLENVLKVMAAVTAMLVACSEVLSQANQYYNLRKDGSTTEATNEATTSSAD